MDAEYLVSNASVVTPIPAQERELELANAVAASDLSGFTSLLRIIPSHHDTDHLEAMLSMEVTRYPCPRDYLLKVISLDGQNSYATESWRRRLCEWMFEVADHFGFDREVVSIASYIMDRSASIAFEGHSGHATKRQYQLVAVASLYLALKIHGEIDPDTEEERLKLRLSNFVELSRGFFSEEAIAAKETEILTSLKWHVNPPTCARFLSCFLEFLPEWKVDQNTDYLIPTRQIVWVKIFDIAKYLTELSVFISAFAFGYDPSTIAYAALQCALEHVQEKSPFPREAQTQLIDSLFQVSSKFCPQQRTIRRLQRKLKKLAPDFFPSSNSPRRIIRTVSFVDVESANYVAAALKRKRVVSPVSASGAENTPFEKHTSKRQCVSRSYRT